MRLRRPPKAEQTSIRALTKAFHEAKEGERVGMAAEELGSPQLKVDAAPAREIEPEATAAVPVAVAAATRHLCRDIAHNGAFSGRFGGDCMCEGPLSERCRSARGIGAR